jgi:hypothetical protein
MHFPRIAVISRPDRMKLGLFLGYSGAHMTLPIERVLEAERLGFDSV